MKKIYTTLALSVLIFNAFSQKGTNKGRAYIGPVATMAIDGGFGLAAGAGYNVTKRFAVGGGFDVIKLNNYNGAYASVFADLRYYVLPGLFINVQGGYSFMNNSKRTTSSNKILTLTSKGGAYYAGGAGYEFKGKKVVPFVSVKAAYYTLNVTNKSQVLVGTSYHTTITNSDLSEIAPTFTVGVKF